MSKYFGTDGIRGVVNKNLGCDLAYKVGKSLALLIKQQNKTGVVLIGKDTRVSGDMLAYSLAAGLSDYGVNSYMLGIVPTGCVSYLSGKLDVGGGVMITASHNTPNMNGIKLITNLGYKFTILEEKAIEQNLNKKVEPCEHKGKILNGEHLVENYVQFLTTDLKIDLSGINIAIDCAYGANYVLAERVFKKLNANLIAINNDNFGERINVNCGALNVKKLIAEVKRHKCWFGFAFDGDGDRLIVVLSDGRVLNGDDILFVLASYMLKFNKLNSRAVVGTIMTNSGTEESLKKLGINLIRTDVGDRNVIEKMLKNNYSLGGEGSGHICVHNLNTTCDALMNCLYLLKIVISEKVDLNEFLLHLKKVPQFIKNVPVSEDMRAGFDNNAELKKQIEKIAISDTAVRVVVRPSGTESIIRIMAEGSETKCNKTILKIEELLVNKKR